MDVDTLVRLIVALGYEVHIGSRRPDNGNGITFDLIEFPKGGDGLPLAGDGHHYLIEDGTAETFLAAATACYLKAKETRGIP